MKFLRKSLIFFLTICLLYGCSKDNSNSKRQQLVSNNISDNSDLKNPPELYLPIKNNEDRWGYVSTNGKVVIDTKLEATEAYPFDPYNNEYAIVKTNTEDKDDWYIINKKGEIIYDERKSIVDYDLLSPYVNQDGNIIVCDNDNLWVLNVNGEKKTTQYYPYFVFKSIAINPDLSCWQEQGNYLDFFCMNRQGEILFTSDVPFIFPYSDMYDETIGLACRHENSEEQTEQIEHYYYIDKQGNKMFEANEFDSATYFTKQGFAVVTKNGQSSIIKKSGEVVYNLKGNEKYITSQDGNIYIMSGSPQQYGLKDLNGNLILNEKYITISTIVDSESKMNFLVTMFENGNYVTYIIDQDENIVTSFKELTLTQETILDIYNQTDGKVDINQLDGYLNPTIIMNNHIIISNQYIFDQNGLLLNLANQDTSIQNYFNY